MVVEFMTVEGEPADQLQGEQARAIREVLEWAQEQKPQPQARSR